jgi:CRP-like cAMP-binding protein
MSDETFSVLRRHFLFSGLSEDQFARIKETAKTGTLKEGQHLFHAGDKAHSFFLLISGLMQLYRISAWGEEKVFEIIHPGQTFAEAVMFFKKTEFPVNAKAIRRCEFWQIDINVFIQLLHESTDLCLYLLGDISRRLHGTMQDIEQLTLQNATVRVIHLLLQFAPENEINRYTVEWETPKQVLASRISVRPETFSRILQHLSRQNLISVNKKNIEVIDLAGLREAIQG